jgi:hypothetical protein
MATKKKAAKKPSLYDKVNKVLPFNLRSGYKRMKKKEKEHFSLLADDLLENNVVVVSVTYELEQVNNCVFENGVIYFGNTEVRLIDDRDPANAKIFKTQNGKTYSCIAMNGALKINIKANGNMGDGWKLTVKVNTRDLTTSPITKDVEIGTGRADHLKQHPLP